MDIWFNSLFSIPISAMLLKTPLTPNILTLFGLFIGFLAGWCFAQGNYLSNLAGGLLLALTAIWDCCDGDVARLKLMESDFGEKLDTACDNIINVFIFSGMMLGVAKTHGWGHALIPFIMLTIGGALIFAFIYFPKDGKGSYFKEYKMYDVIQVLASRNFIYVILLFALGGHRLPHLRTGAFYR
jgi:phosphatidylglycerophosphate synthase